VNYAVKKKVIKRHRKGKTIAIYMVIYGFLLVFLTTQQLFPVNNDLVGTCL